MTAVRQIEMKIFYIIALFFYSLPGVQSQSPVEEYLNFAVRHTENRQHEEAIRACDKLIELLPGNPDIYFLRGVNKYLIKDYDGAITDLNVTISIIPNHADAYLFRARSKKGKRDYFGALRDYNIARNENFYETVSSLTSDFISSLLRK